MREKKSSFIFKSIDRENNVAYTPPHRHVLYGADLENRTVRSCDLEINKNSNDEISGRR